MAARTISVPILAGSAPVVEGLESFTLQLLNPQNVTIQSGEASGTIKDDDAILVTTPDSGNAPLVKVYNAATGALKYTFMAYNVAFTGGVRVATGDVNGDGVPDIITAPGAGGGPHVRVFNGATSGQDDAKVISEFFAFSSSHTGGVFLAVADVTGDGVGDVIASKGGSSLTTIRVFHGATNQVAWEIYPFGNVLNYSHGAQIAAGDTNGDGRAEVIAATAPASRRESVSLTG